MENNSKDSQLNINTISSLVASIHSDATDYLDEQLKNQGMSEIAASHGFILFLLSQNKAKNSNDLEPMTMKEIARKIDKDKSTTTVLIRKLINLGYVHRNKDEKDIRYSYISLTQKGISFTDKMQTISKELSEKFYSGFTEEEKKTVFTLLKKIQSNFN